MNWLKRALLSLWGHKGRSILLILVFSVIATLIFSGLVIGSVARQAVEQTKNTVGASVVLRAKPVQEDHTTTYPNTPYNVAEKFTKLKYVKASNYSTQFEMKFDNLTAIRDEAEWKNELEWSKKYGYKVCDAEVVGVSNSELSDSFLAGGYKLVEGRHIAPSDKGTYNVLISKQLADKNKLKPGDKFEMSTVYSKPYKTEKFTVVGVFQIPAEQSIVAGLTYTNPLNFVFGSYTVIDSIFTSPDERGAMTVTCFLDDPNHLNDFIKLANSEVDSSKYDLLTNQSWYKRMIPPLQTMERMANQITPLVCASGLAVMLLLILLLLRGRKHEFGLLMSMGEKRTKIFTQVLVENLLPAVIAFCIAISVTGLLSGQIGGRILSDNAQKIAEAQKKEDDQALVNGKDVKDSREAIITHDARVASSVSSLDFKVTGAEVAVCAGAELLLILISVGISSVSILRLSPSQVLNKKE